MWYFVVSINNVVNYECGGVVLLWCEVVAVPDACDKEEVVGATSNIQKFLCYGQKNGLYNSLETRKDLWCP